MSWRGEWKPLTAIVAVFLLFYFLPIGTGRFDVAVTESLALAKWYAREHVLLCLVPAFFIAGAISVFVNQHSVLKYLGPEANKVVAYSVASVAGLVLAVCSCTVLPLFAGIYAAGAGLGAAAAFLYSGPAISVLAIILTARILGPEIGLARAVGAVIFAVVIGLLMHFIFRRDEEERARGQMALPPEEEGRPLSHVVVLFAFLVGILVFANWGRPAVSQGLWHNIYSWKWGLTAMCAGGLGVTLARCFGLSRIHVLLVAIPTVALTLLLPEDPVVPFVTGTIGLSIVTSTREGELGEWFAESWRFAKMILPLLFVGVIIAGLLLGRPGHEALVPSAWIADSVGGNSPGANLFASVAGAFMYFATLTEVPILEGLLGAGMGKGPALALLLAGPAVSLPSLLVIRSVIGTRKTMVFTALVMVMATFTGWFYGSVWG